MVFGTRSALCAARQAEYDRPTHGCSQERHPLYYYPPRSSPYYFQSSLRHVASDCSSFALHSMATSRSYVLLQKGEDPFHARFEDLDGLTAFTVYVCRLLYRDIYLGELTFL